MLIPDSGDDGRGVGAQDGVADAFWRTAAGVLHLGQVAFEAAGRDGDGNRPKLDPKSARFWIQKRPFWGPASGPRLGPVSGPIWVAV